MTEVEAILNVGRALFCGLWVGFYTLLGVYIKKPREYMFAGCSMALLFALVWILYLR